MFTSIEIDTTAPSNLSGLDLSNDTGVSATDDLADNTSLDTTALAGEGLGTGGNVETSTITYFAMTDAGTGTSGWETSTSALSFDGTGQTGTPNTVYYKQIDAAGNESGVSSYTFTYDDTDPSVSGLTSPSGTDTDGEVTFTLTFNEPMDAATVMSDDLTVTGVGDASIIEVSPVSGTATSFTVKVTGTGDVGSSLDLAASVGAQFADAAGNSITLTTEVTDTAAIDTVHPSVVSFDTTHTTGDHIKAGETVAITATMSETVQAGGQITVNLSSGGSAVLTADAEGTTLSGTYTVLASENADTLAVDTIVLNDSAPVDLAGNVMTDNTVPSADLGSAGIEVDTVADQGFDLSVTVDPLDKTVSDEESGHVSFLVGGVDADYASVVVTVSDDYSGSASADAVWADGHWVASVDVGGLQDQSRVTPSVTMTDDAGNVATATTSPIFLDMSADADGDLNVAIVGTGTDGDEPVGFEITGVDLVDTVAINLGLQTGDGSADLSISVDPVALGTAGLGLLGRAAEMVDELGSLVATLDGLLPGGPVAVDSLFATVETDLNIETGTLRTLSGLTRGDLADAMQSVGVDHRLEDLVRYATPEDLAGLALSVDRDPEIQALIDQGGSLLTVAEVLGVVNALGFDYSQINSLVSIDPETVRQSAESGAIGNLSMTASIIGFDVPDVGATLDRLAAVMDRHIGDVALTGADGAVGENVINLTLEAVGGTHSVEGVSDEGSTWSGNGRS